MFDIREIREMPKGDLKELAEDICAHPAQYPTGTMLKVHIAMERLHLKKEDLYASLSNVIDNRREDEKRGKPGPCPIKPKLQTDQNIAPPKRPSALTRLKNALISAVNK